MGFLNIHSVAKHQKIEGGTLWGIFFQKSLTVPKKKQIGDSLISPGTVRYAEKEEKPFWFSLLGQMIQFGTIKFRRTFKNYFVQFKWTTYQKMTERRGQAFAKHLKITIIRILRNTLLRETRSLFDYKNFHLVIMLVDLTFLVTADVKNIV